MNTFLLFGFVLLTTNMHAQKNDTIRKYLDRNLQFTSRSSAVYPAVGFKVPDAWFLQVLYPDTSVLLKAYFKDKNFAIKNGPYLLYHGRNVKAMEGTYVNNIAQGLWRYWHVTGQLKDSGLLVNNVMCGTWKSWAANGQLLVSVDYNNSPDGAADASRRPPAKPGKKAPGILPDDSPVPGTRDGLSLAYFPNGQLQDSGRYIDDLRTGLWKTWYENGKLDAEGNYISGNMQGDWTYYRSNGHKSTEEKYVSGKLQSMTCYDSLGNKEGDYCSILKPPVPLGPFDTFADYVLDNIFWPKELVNSEVQGVVRVEYVITKSGDLTNFRVVESPHQLLSDEVTRFLTTIEKWSPAVSHNRVIDFQMKFDVPFYH
jgi:antitoxin component YwqK of YwqJK toxin-antitoxin module